MFDLNYYKELSKMEDTTYFDKDKGNVMSRQSIHNLFKNGKKNIWNNRINDLPDDDPLKSVIKTIYEQHGETGLVKLMKKLNKDT